MGVGWFDLSEFLCEGVVGLLLANQEKELTQEDRESGRKAASRNSRVVVAGHPVQKGMDANLGSLDRVYEALAASRWW